MKYCRNCRNPVDEERERRCSRCAASLVAPEALIAGDELAVVVHGRKRRADGVIFVLGNVLLAVLPCLLFGTTPLGLVLGAILAAVGALVLLWTLPSSFAGLLVFSLPQILLSGINFFAWLLYLCLGMAIGIWRMSMREMQ